MSKHKPVSAAQIALLEKFIGKGEHTWIVTYGEECEIAHQLTESGLVFFTAEKNTIPYALAVWITPLGKRYLSFISTLRRMK